MKQVNEERKRAYEDFSIDAAIRDFDKAIGILNELKRKVDFCFCRKGEIEIKHPDTLDERVKYIAESLKTTQKEVRQIIDEISLLTNDYISEFQKKLPGINVRYLHTGEGNVSHKESPISSYSVEPEKLNAKIEDVKNELIELRRELENKRDLE